MDKERKSGTALQGATGPVTRRKLVAGGALMLLAGTAMLTGCARGTSTHAGRQARRPVHDQAIDFDPQAVLAKVNAARRRHLLPPLVLDPRLMQAAQSHASEMGRTGLYGHEIGPGTDFVTRIRAVGYDQSSGENIGVGYASAEEAVQGWLDSPGHRTNMLKRGHRLAGIGYAYNVSGRNSDYTHFWVLIMGADDGA